MKFTIAGVGTPGHARRVSSRTLDRAHLVGKKQVEQVTRHSGEPGALERQDEASRIVFRISPLTGFSARSFLANMVAQRATPR